MANRPIPDDRERVLIIREYLQRELRTVNRRLTEPVLVLAPGADAEDPNAVYQSNPNAAPVGASHRRDTLEEMLAFVTGLGAESEALLHCTGVAASWCPIHGDCFCPRLPSGERELESDSCPLHGSTSNHAMERA